MRWVVADAALAPVLDAQDGLLRERDLWRVGPATGRAALTPGAARTAMAGARSAPGTTPLSGPCRPGRRAGCSCWPSPRTPAGTPSSPADGSPERRAWGWAQGFAVPAAGGTVELLRDGSAGRVAAQALGLLVVGVLAVPGVAGPRVSRGTAGSGCAVALLVLGTGIGSATVDRPGGAAGPTEVDVVARRPPAPTGR